MIPLQLVQLKGAPILEQLKWEEAILRADNRNWCVINHGSPPAIVMGISGQLQTLVDQQHLQTSPIPVIRRFSGGGTVVIDEDTLFVTFIFNKQDLPVPSFPEPIMRWTEQFYRPLFHPHPFNLQENDYVMENKKFGGNAQSITKTRWLHHSSFLYNYNSHRMKYLHLPAKAPSYRHQRSHEEFLCCLKDYWPSLENLTNKLVSELRKGFRLVKTDTEELNRLLELPHRKATKLEGENQI
jgi:lipoate-protein ligase A